MTIRNTAHAQRMYTHQLTQVKPSDPREQDIKPAPEPGSYYRQFRKELKASGQVKAIADLIANAHALYEGWTSHVWAPPSAMHKQQAERAIRACSPECRSAATTAMEHYVLTALERLDQRNKSCDMTREDFERERKMIARIGLEVYDFHLLHEVGRSHHEMKQLDETPLEDPEE